MAVVYEHLRNDTNEVFYVGIGKTTRRVYSELNRNKHWKNITNKVGYSVEIIHSDVNWHEACELEKHLIFLFGRKDLGLGPLVNMTDGGEGTLGCKSNLGSKRSEEAKQKMSEAQKGKTRSEEAKQKMSDLKLGKTRSEETRKKISEATKGKTRSEETKQKMSEAKKGKTPMLGKTHTEESKQKMSEAHKNKKSTI